MSRLKQKTLRNITCILAALVAGGMAFADEIFSRKQEEKIEDMEERLSALENGKES